MSVSVKFTDIIKVYDGESDFSEWLKKLQLVAKLQNVTDLVSFLPLFMSGGAFAVYEGLDDKVKTDFVKLNSALRKAFSENRFDAYDQFVNRRLEVGESVDVYVADLKRLAALVADGLSSTWIQCAMVRGLPSEMQMQLKAACQFDKLSLSETLERCRLLVTTTEEVGMVAQSKRGWKSSKERVCFSCGSSSHFIKACPKNQKRACFRCGELSHLAASCPAASDAVADPKNE